MEDGFQKMFVYFEDFRSEVNGHFDRMEADITDLRGAIGELSAQVRDYHNETILMSHQIDKLKEAIKQIAQETGIKLAVEL